MIYELDDKIGMRFKIDTVKTSPVTVSGVVLALPETPLRGRDYIKVKNTGGVDAVILSAANQNASDGYIIDANGGEFIETTNAPLYVVSTGAVTTLRVYERTSKIGK